MQQPDISFLLSPSFYPRGSPLLVFPPCSRGGLLFPFPLPPLDHCQWESPSNPCFCPARYRLTLPPHICMSCDVSAKVCPDVMGTDGSIFPADSDDCRAQVQLWVCVCALWAHPSCYGSMPELTGYPPAPTWVRTEDLTWQPQVCEATVSPPLFSMLCFTWFSILLPLFPPPPPFFL